MRGEVEAPFEVDVVVKKTTDKALLCEIDGEEHWIPRSQCLDGTSVEDEGDEGSIVIPAWLARAKGIA